MENQNDINNEENKNAIKLDLNDSIISSQDKKDKEKDKDKEKLPMIDADPSSTPPTTLISNEKIERSGRRKSTFVDVEKAQKEAESLLKGEDETGAKSNLLFGEKSITIFRLYGHLNRPIDYFCMVIFFIFLS